MLRGVKMLFGLYYWREVTVRRYPIGIYSVFEG